MPVLFHTTPAADDILRDGFRDRTGFYLLVGVSLTGVFLADVPLDSNEGATGDQLLEVRMPDESDLAPYELVEDGKSYREWCVPAALINDRGTVRLLDGPEADDVWQRRWLGARPGQ